MLRTLYLACVLVMAPAVAWAQAAPQTTAAQATVVADGQGVTQAVIRRAQTAQRYQDQLAAIDRLKKQKASWRRDRELRADLADSADTANQLATLNQQLATATRALIAARTELLAAIDREQKNATGSRIAQLAELRAKVTATFGPAPKKIVLPDAEVDLLADPEELDQQAQVIAETEKQLAHEVAGLDAQAAELAHVADLRKHNDRAKDLMLSEDDQPHRNVQSSSGSRALASNEAVSPPSTDTGTGAGQSSGGGSFSSGSTSGAFETEATFVLGEVIDRSTIDGLTRAQRSGDPAKRAEAAGHARDAVSQRLELLRKKRAQIEARSKQLRSAHR